MRTHTHFGMCHPFLRVRGPVRLAALITLLLMLFSAPALAATLVVDTTSDTGASSACTAAPADCSLRGAINASNGLPGADSI
ncbi:MAG: hypothetical protein KDI51_13685, partial [Xanthomonadales bacterium]|nr:hypothetical protein [Xanthomonadales bacterium]